MLPSRWLHFVGLVMFLGSALGALVGNRVREKGADAVTARLVRLANVGLLVLLVSGFGMIVASGDTRGMFRRPFIHAMLTALLVGGAMLGVASGQARKLEDGNESARGKITTFTSIAIVAGLAAIAAGVWRL